MRSLAVDSVSCTAVALLLIRAVHAASPQYYQLQPEHLRRDASALGLCGAWNGTMSCPSSGIGRCCSQFGYCGDTALHCGTGCQSAYGICSTPSSGSGSSTAAATSTGGSYNTGLYQNSTRTSPASVATSACSAPQWVSMGCYIDSTSSRTLPNRVYLSSSTTIELCQAACGSAGYSYAGLEYYSECYCGNALLGAGKAAAGDWQCTYTACSGNGSQSCGGPNRLNVFSFGSSCSTSPSSAATTQATTQATQATIPTTTGNYSSAAASSATVFSAAGASPTALGWNYQGCYSDNVASRTLVYKASAGGWMTPDSCKAMCLSAGNFIYAGVEYASECWCGNSIQNGGQLAAPSGGDACNMGCTGDSNQICGGSNRLNLFYYNSGTKLLASAGSNSSATTTSAAAPVNTAGSGDWAGAYVKANAAMANLTNASKVKMVTGMGWKNGPCLGNTAAVPEIGYPQLCLQDGPLGIRWVQGVTAFPAGVHVASTWDTSLMYSRGNAMGTESKALGIHVQLGPVAGPLGKIPNGGRGWEGFSVDPYLTGVAMAETITGMQDAGVQACAKHFLGYEQETLRDTMSANIPDRVNHELYLWPFAESVKANVATIMCGYNKINSSYACENSQALSLITQELNFQGYILSDWTAQHTTINSANAGLDMSMPGDNYGDNNFLWGQNLLGAVSAGAVPQTRLDNMVRRILAAWYKTGQDGGSYPTVSGWNSFNGGAGGPNVQGNHGQIARTIARDGIVLLKNDNSALPLQSPASLAIIGQDAFANPNGPNACIDRGCNVGTLAQGWGSGTAEYPYLITPYQAIAAQAAIDGTKVVTSMDDTTTGGATAASAAATAIVFITADSGELYLTVEGVAGDRPDLDPWHSGNDLVAAVAAINTKTIVVVHSVGPVILESVLSNPNVVAVVWAGLPGQESGNGLADILYGRTAPSGKLPYTIAKSASDYGTGIVYGDDNYSEGLNVDYRHFDSAGITPRYEFGYGLSYTTFAYSGLSAVVTDRSAGSSTLLPGGPSGLYDVIATVTATVTNNGTVTGAEVAQLYIGIPAADTPPKQLRGFNKLSLAPGASGTVTFSLRRKDLSYWDVGSQQWLLPSGSFGVFVGSSSRDIRLTGSM